MVPSDLIPDTCQYPEFKVVKHWQKIRFVKNKNIKIVVYFFMRCGFKTKSNGIAKIDGKKIYTTSNSKLSALVACNVRHILFLHNQTYKKT